LEGLVQGLLAPIVPFEKCLQILYQNMVAHLLAKDT